MENKRLFGLICYIQRQMSRENGAMLAEYGLTPVQLHTMVFVRKMQKSGKSVCQKDIEKQINLRASSVSTLLTTLEKRGFLKRVSGGDARTKNIELTKQGENLCERSKKLMDECDGAIASALTDTEQEELKNLLTKILKSTEQSEKEQKD